MSMFIHELTRVRTPLSGAEDEYGQPTPGTPSTLPVRGLVQPQTAREQDDSRSAGAEVADHTIFLPIIDLSHEDYLLYGGDRYDVLGIRRFEFGTLAHLEVAARRVSGALVGDEGNENWGTSGS